MLNAQEAEAAFNALTYSHSDNEDKNHAAIRAEYSEAEAKITAEFRAWLINEYASHFSTALQSRIWDKAWAAGSMIAGYSVVEDYFKDYAEFAEFAISTK